MTAQDDRSTTEPPRPIQGMPEPTKPRSSTGLNGVPYAIGLAAFVVGMFMLRLIVALFTTDAAQDRSVDFDPVWATQAVAACEAEVAESAGGVPTGRYEVDGGPVRYRVEVVFSYEGFPDGKAACVVDASPSGVEVIEMTRLRG